jgi:hypothetical protein
MLITLPPFRHTRVQNFARCLALPQRGISDPLYKTASRFLTKHDDLLAASWCSPINRTKEYRGALTWLCATCLNAHGPGSLSCLDPDPLRLIVSHCGRWRRVDDRRHALGGSFNAHAAQTDPQPFPRVNWLETRPETFFLLIDSLALRHLGLFVPENDFVFDQVGVRVLRSPLGYEFPAHKSSHIAARVDRLRPELGPHRGGRKHDLLVGNWIKPLDCTNSARCRLRTFSLTKEPEPQRPRQFAKNKNSIAQLTPPK